MKDHIAGLITQQHKLLCSAIKQRSFSNIALCDLQNVNFNSGGVPNYTDAAQQSLYLLRYAPAYTVEYRLAFDKIFSGNRIATGDVNILSVGCGAAIDKASVFFAMNNTTNHFRAALRYYGVDLIDWNYDIFPEKRSNFIHKGIESVFTSDIPSCIDIVIFPKSLPEIDICLLKRFFANMDKRNFYSKLCIINSNRCAYDDNAKAAEFCKLFCDTFNYEVQDSFDIGPIKNPDTDKPLCIWEVFPGEHFSFPQDAINTSNNISTLCVANGHFETCTQCAGVINRTPMLTTPYFNTRVYCLGRK